MSTSRPIKTPYDSIRNITLTNILAKPDLDATFPARQMWAVKPTVIVVIRRPGCQFCREEARNLNDHRDLLENTMNVNMVAVIHESEGAEAFQNGFWHGDVFLDTNKDFYRALGGGQLRTAGWTTLLKPSFWPNLIRNKKAGVHGNFVGDGSILGGLLIVKPDDQGIAYEHVEKIWGDIDSSENVIKVCSEITGVAYDPAVLVEARAKHNAHKAKVQKKIQKEGGNPSCAVPAAESSSGTAGDASTSSA